MTRTSSLAAFSVVALLAAGPALAQPIDSFLIGSDPAAGEYTAGNLLGQGPDIIGWAGNWNDQFQGDRPQVVNTGLSYLTVPVAGGSVETLEGEDGRAWRALSNPTDDATNRTFYMSFMMQAVGAEDVGQSQITYSTLEMHNAISQGDGDRQVQVGVGENLNGSSQTPNYIVSLFNSDLGSGLAADLGTNDELVNFFVMKFELSDVNDADVFSLYHNPTDLANEPVTPDFTATGFNISLNSAAIARFGNAGTLTYDEIRMGNTYDSVTSVVPDFVPGDTDGNFIVEFPEDFEPIRDNWLETNESFGSTLERADGDLNLNGIVGIEDFREWKNAYLQQGGSAEDVAAALASLGASAAPEPTTLCLMVMGFAGLCGSRRSQA